MSTNKQRANRYAPLLAIALLLFSWLIVKQCNPNSDNASNSRGLDRNVANIVYSKHARCRMDCRQISEMEVKELIANGIINYRKSEIGERTPCQRKYALEGNTNDGQRVRLIVAPCKDRLTVVTVIDLGQEHACNCK